jgi:hypothetical protein
MILNGDPGPEDRYSFFAIVLTDEDNDVVHGAIIHPVNSKNPKGHRVYLFVFGGCAWYYFVSSHSTRNYFEYSFSQNQKLYVVNKKFREFDCIQNSLKIYGEKRRAF